MADIYIINSENPKDIALELQQLDPSNTYTVLKSHNTAKAILVEIEKLKYGNDISMEQKKEIFLALLLFEWYNNSRLVTASGC